MTVETKYGEALMKQTQEIAEMFKAAMPKLQLTKMDMKLERKF